MVYEPHTECQGGDAGYMKPRRKHQTVGLRALEFRAWGLLRV